MPLGHGASKLVKHISYYDHDYCFGGTASTGVKALGTKISPGNFHMPGIVLGPGNMIMRNKIEMVFALIEFII